MRNKSKFIAAWLLAVSWLTGSRSLGQAPDKEPDKKPGPPVVEIAPPPRVLEPPPAFAPTPVVGQVFARPFLLPPFERSALAEQYPVRLSPMPEPPPPMAVGPFRTPWFSYGLPYRTSSMTVGRPTTVVRNQPRLFEDRDAYPLPGNSTILPMQTGVKFEIYPTRALPTSILTDVQVRADVVAESTVRRDNTEVGPGFFITKIPVKGDPFFNSGWSSDSFGTGGTPKTTTIQNVSLTQIDQTLGSIMTFFEMDFFDEMRPEKTRVDVRSLYGQFAITPMAATVGVGQTYSTFSDILVKPDIADMRGPNAIFAGKRDKIWGSFSTRKTDREDNFLEISIEDPQPQILNPRNLKVVSRIPDLIGAYTWQNQDYGMARFAWLARGMGLESADGSFRDNVIGWGVKVSTALTPFAKLGLLKNDAVYASFTYGEAIARYNLDLVDTASDAAPRGDGTLNGLPVISFFVAYTHFWTDRLRSTILYSEVNLDGEKSQGPTSYHQGQYFLTNLFYSFPKNNVHLGLEYVYGRRETFNRYEGDAHRLQFVVVLAGNRIDLAPTVLTDADGAASP